MQNEPQLSAEIEKRFNDLFKYSLWSDADSLGVDMGDKVKHFLATALEEQRDEYVRKVEELPRDRKITVYDTTKEIVYDKHLISKEKVLAILNGETL